MEHLTKDVIKRLLAEPPTAPVVTIYLPTHRSASPPHMSEDQIRFKNLIHKAADILKNRDDGRELRQELCDRLEALLDEKTFWEQRTEGLLVCGRPGKLSMFNLPRDTEEYVSVDTYYHLAPIFSLANDMHEYYVLAVAQHNPALFKGDNYEVRLSGINLPPSVEEGLNIDEMNQKSEQQRSVGGMGGFNGRGGAKNPAEEERLRFFRTLDSIINDKADRSLPLILAGIEAEVVEFKNASNYPNLTKGYIAGSFSGAKPQDLWLQSQKIIQEELVEPTHRSAIEQYEMLKGENESRTGSTIAAIADAADDGRVDKLLLGMLRYTTDTVRDNTERLPVISFPGAEESTQALHKIATAVWSAGGQVVNLEQNKMPEGLTAAAIFRY